MSDLKSIEIPGRIEVSSGKGGLSRILVKTGVSSAEIYPLGAHVTSFQKDGEAPLLFMSEESWFEVGSPIRGGVPVIFPWFGPREGLPSHGFARTVEWDVTEAVELADGAVRLRFRMPTVKPYQVEFTVTVGETLAMELIVLNDGEKETEFETCLHTYFHVGLIDSVSVSGLKGCEYYNQVKKENLFDPEDPIRIREEVDRVYYDTSAPVEIEDASLGRTITVTKSGSLSTVVWNPWVAKSKAMPDFGENEFRHMVCVESGNMGKNKVALLPGQSATLAVQVASGPMKG